MKFELEPWNRDFDNQDLIADLKRVASILGKGRLTQAEYRIHGKFHPSTITRRFANWQTALDAAGIQGSRAYRMLLEEWFTNLADVWTRLGRQPRPRDMRKPLSRYSYAGYKRRFGGWRKALKQFVEYVNSDSAPMPTGQPQEATRRISPATPRNVGHRLRFLVMRRDSFKCRACGRSPATHSGVELVIDHVRPWAPGGETTFENLQTLCFDCNAGKGDLAFQEADDARK